MAERIYQTALGIQTGDIVRTSYKTGPYEVWAINGPRYASYLGGTLFVRTWLVISLILVDPEKGGGKFNSEYSYINDIRREDDRWFTDSNDEIFVEKKSATVQMGMFDNPAPEPYAFNPDVDYSVYGQAHRCKKCGDFNAPCHGNSAHAYCPTCGGWSEFMIYVMEPREIENRQLNSFTLSIS